MKKNSLNVEENGAPEHSRKQNKILNQQFSSPESSGACPPASYQGNLLEGLRTPEELPLDKSEEHGQSSALACNFYERPDGEKVFFCAEDSLIDSEDDFGVSIFEDANLAIPNVSSSPSNFAQLTEDDYRSIQHGYRCAAEKVKTFPIDPGVYLMKDAAARVIYVGKAKRLRNRASSYFRREAIDDHRVGALVREIRDIDYIPAASEVDALLMESRLIKDLQPKYNRDLKDDKSFPYIQITIREDFPRVEATRKPRDSNVRLYGPFLNGGQLRSAIVVLQKIFKFRTCTLSINKDSSSAKWERPCVLASIGQCSAPCCGRISIEAYRRNIRRLQEFLSGDRERLIKGVKEDMLAASRDRKYELAALYRDQALALESLKIHGKIDENVQPEVFQIDPRHGILGLQKIFKLQTLPRIIEGVDVAHLSGEDTVSSLVHFVDGRPFKSGYRRYRIKTVDGIDDFASIAETVSRRFAYRDPRFPPPDILLIDGGKGQLHAALEALKKTACQPKLTISLAKREEEIYVPGREEPLRLSRRSYALRLLQSVRDESHRFAQHYHHLLRRKSTFGDAFFQIKRDDQNK